MRSVCFVTCLRWPEISASDRLVQDALTRRGFTVVGRAWNESHARFDGFGLVVLRSNWDYHYAPDDFTAWLARWERAGARIWNPPALVRWNLTKGYLLDLASRGLGVVPTAILAGASALPSVMAERGWAQAVVKPLVSASGHDTVLVDARSVDEVARALEEGRIRQPAIVQPFVEAIQSRGEWSLVFIDGAFTHAALKRPGAGDFRVQQRYGGVTVAAVAPAAIIGAAEAILRVLPAPTLYARVDGVETEAGFLVMEVEVNEPGLFFNLAPEAAERFATAIASRFPR